VEINKETHRELGKTLSGEVWSFLEKADRTPDDSRRMVHAAHASHYHWLHAGTKVHEQRGEWLLARVYAVLGLGEASLRHAERCRDITDQHGDEMKDFDLAFSSEGLARAHAALRRKAEAKEHKTEATKLGDRIVDKEDKEIFVAELSGGEWHGVD
jgi:hypothetical protein